MPHLQHFSLSKHTNFEGNVFTLSCSNLDANSSILLIKIRPARLHFFIIAEFFFISYLDVPKIQYDIHLVHFIQFPSHQIARNRQFP
jgi:hypothetical protein